MNLLAKQTYLLIPETPVQEINEKIRNRLVSLGLQLHKSLIFDVFLSQDGSAYNRFAYNLRDTKNSSQFKVISLYNYDDDDRANDSDIIKGFGGLFGRLGYVLARENIFRYAELHVEDKNEDRLCNESFCKPIHNIIVETISPYIYRCKKCSSIKFQIESWSYEDPKFDIDKIAHGITAVLLLNPITRGHGSASEWSKATAQRMKSTGITYTCKKCREQITQVLSNMPVSG